MSSFVYPIGEHEADRPGAKFRYIVPGRQKRNIPPTGAGKQAFVKGEPTRFTGEALAYQTMLEIGWLPEQIEYHRTFAGGRNFVGGIEVDFFVATWPVPTAIFYDGDYWHSGERQWVDIENDERLMALFFGALNIVHIFEGSDAASVDTLRNKLLKEIGPGVWPGHSDAI